jgi:hypothetical protein
MKADPRTERRRWLAAAAAGAVLTAGVAALFRAPGPFAPPPAAPAPWIFLANADSLLREATALHDPAPLFLPTEWNSRPAPPTRDPGVAFSSYAPDYHFPTDGLAVALPRDLPANFADALADNPPGNPLLGLGRSDAPVPSLRPRGAFVEIVAAGTGATVLSTALPDARPPEGVLWHPLEFLAAVDAAGLVGPLVLTGPSDVDAVNGYFERYLTQTFRVGERLSPGIYHLRIAP